VLDEHRGVLVSLVVDDPHVAEVLGELFRSFIAIGGDVPAGFDDFGRVVVYSGLDGTNVLVNLPVVVEIVTLRLVFENTASNEASGSFVPLITLWLRLLVS